MRFGIAIPVAGQAQFIGNALQSVKAQSVDYQLAIMDATPDESVQQIVRRYSDIVSYNRHGPDAGQAVAIREGWERVDAELLGWLCADDYYFPYTLAEVRSIFATQEGVDVVYGDTVFADQAGRFLGYFPWISEDISRITRSCCISQPSCFVRRAAVERIGGLATDLHFVMDWDLWTRLYLSGAKFYYLKKPLAVCRMYEETKTASRSQRRYQEIRRHLKMYTGRMAGMRSLLGFYYQDLLTRRTSWIDWVVYGTIGGTRGIKRWGGARLGRKKALYGLEKETNAVQERGEVWLPWFEDTEQCLANIVVDRGITLRVAVPGGREEVVVCQLEGKTYKASVLIDNIRDKLVRLDICAMNSKSPWHVKAVELSLPSLVEAQRDGSAKEAARKKERSLLRFT